MGHSSLARSGCSPVTDPELLWGKRRSSSGGDHFAASDRPVSPRASLSVRTISRTQFKQPNKERGFRAPNYPPDAAPVEEDRIAGAGRGERERKRTMHWRIDLLGRLRVAQEGRDVTPFLTQKVAALLAYLAYYPRQSHPRELLIELLWPEIDPEAGRHNLRSLLH